MLMFRIIVVLMLPLVLTSVASAQKESYLRRALSIFQRVCDAGPKDSGTEWRYMTGTTLDDQPFQFDNFCKLLVIGLVDATGLYGYDVELRVYPSGGLHLVYKDSRKYQFFKRIRVISRKQLQTPSPGHVRILDPDGGKADHQAVWDIFYDSYNRITRVQLGNVAATFF